MTAAKKDALQGHWVHSHEEDSGGELVFRPAAQPLPPSRGRASFDLRSDGSYRERAPGPTDAPEQAEGHWTVDNDRLVLRGPDGQPRHSWTIAAIESDCLKLKRSEEK